MKRWRSPRAPGDPHRLRGAPGSLAELLQLVEQSLDKSQSQLQTLDPASLYHSRSVGRRALPTTVIGLIVHLAEHTQRHLGQAIVIAKFLRQNG